MRSKRLKFRQQRQTLPSYILTVINGIVGNSNTTCLVLSSVCEARKDMLHYGGTEKFTFCTKAVAGKKMQWFVAWI